MGKVVRIFNIEDFSVDDGPGIRTVIFFKGCSLACRWCHNPESISKRREILVYEHKCIGCGECFKVCPAGAHRMDGERHVIDREKCSHCMKCAGECFSGALVQAGEDVETEELIRRILGNKAYFDQSGGGVTFSGGECMLQAEGLAGILEACREAGVHTAVDTCGNVPWESFARVLPAADLFLYDLKAMDSEVHRRCTGSGNERILANFERLYAEGARIAVRIPCVPGWNDGELEKIADYLEKFPGVEAELLGYHELGNAKYHALGREPIKARMPGKEELNELRKSFGFR